MVELLQEQLWVVKDVAGVLFASAVHVLGVHSSRVNLRLILRKCRELVIIIVTVKESLDGIPPQVS